jgi:Tol biopolymer transport system component
VKRSLHAGMAPFSLIALLLACSHPAHQAPDFKIALVPSRTGQHGIFVTHSDSSGTKLLTSDPTAQLRRSSWSPDGRKIAFFANRPQDSEIMAKYRTPAHFPLYIMNSGGGDAQRLLSFPVSGFAWAPDSRRLFFISAYEDPAANDPDVLRGSKQPLSAVYYLDLETQKSTRLTSFGTNCSAAWSPDGNRLAISLRSDEQSNLYVASPDGKTARRLLQSSNILLVPSWSPDGNTLAFISLPLPGTNTQDGGAYLIDPSGGKPQLLAAVSAFEVSWSPDGNTLMLQAGDGIHLVGRDGRGLARVPLGRHRPVDACFTPDGKRLVFRSDADGAWLLWTADRDGKDQKRATGLSASQYSLSPVP